MYGTTCPYLPFGCQPSRQCVVSMRRTSCLFITYTAPPARRGRRIHAARELWQGNRPARTKMPLCWQDVANMRFLGGNPWQVLRSMHPKSGLGRENRQFVAAYCRRVFKMSWLWQNMRAMHPKSPANRLSGTHGVKILPGKGSFRCTGPSNHALRANLAIL